MASFPIFKDVIELKNILSTTDLSDLTTRGDDGKTYFEQIIDQIHNTAAANQELEGKNLAAFVKLLTSKMINLNEADTGEFSPLGHLFKNFTDNKSAKHVFRELLNKDNLDWYKDTRLNITDELARGPVLLQVLTQTSTKNVIKRLDECIGRKIQIDFEMLHSSSVTFGEDLSKKLGNNLLSFDVVLKKLYDANQLTGIESFISGFMKNNSANGFEVLNYINRLGIKLDASKLHISDVLLHITKDVDQIVNHAKLSDTIGLIKSVHKTDEAPIGFSKIFTRPVGGAAVTDLVPKAENLAVHTLSALSKPQVVKSQEALYSLLRIFKMHDIEFIGPAFDNRATSAIISNLLNGLPAEDVKSVLKNIVGTKSLSASIILMSTLQFINRGFVSINDVFSAFIKYEEKIDFNLSYNTKKPDTASCPDNSSVHNKLLDLVLFLMNANKMDNVHALKNMSQVAKTPIDFGYIAEWRDGSKLSILDGIKHDDKTIDGILHIMHQAKELGINIPMNAVVAEHLAKICEKPSDFQTIQKDDIFKESEAKEKASFFLKIKPVIFLHTLQLACRSEIEIDFSDSMPALMQKIQNVLAICTKDNSYSWVLFEMLTLITNTNVRLSSEGALTEGIINTDDFEDMIEQLNVVQSFERKIKCATNKIIPKALGCAKKKEAVSKIINIALKFASNPPDWDDIFISSKHNNIKDDYNLFVSEGVNFSENFYFKLIKRCDDIPNLMAFLKAQGFDLDTQFVDGNTLAHLLALNPSSHLSDHLNNVDLLQILDLNAKNDVGKSVFELMIGNSTTQEIFNMLRNSWELLMRQNINVTNGELKDFLLKYLSGNAKVVWENLNIILSKTNNAGEPSFNVNLVDGSGNRVIDYVVQKDYEMSVIYALRRIGSVEPRKPICFAKGEKLDLSNQRLDCYEPNKGNVVKLVDLMSFKYPLTEEQMDKLIKDFKDKFASEVAGSQAISWGYGVNTIPQLIDAIANLGRQMQDRISKPVDCKKVIATMIKIVEENGDIVTSHPADPTVRMDLKHLFVNVICGLSRCHLGKLINLVALVQDILLSDSDHTDYALESVQQQYDDLLVKVLDNVKLKLSANAAPKAITKWIYDIAVQGIKPQDWTLDTHMVQGIFNDIIIASGIAKSPESYHFTDILELKSRIFAEQMRKLEFKGSNPAWNEMAELGVTELAIDFCEKLIKAEKAGQEFDECLSKEGVYVTDLANGNFSLVDPAIFLTACNRVSVSKRGAFLEFLKDKFQLNDQAEGAIDDIINHAMGDGASQGAVDDVVPGESAELIGDDDSYS